MIRSKMLVGVLALGLMAGGAAAVWADQPTRPAHSEKGARGHDRFQKWLGLTDDQMRLRPAKGRAGYHPDRAALELQLKQQTPLSGSRQSAHARDLAAEKPQAVDELTSIRPEMAGRGGRALLLARGTEPPAERQRDGVRPQVFAGFLDHVGIAVREIYLKPCSSVIPQV